MGFADALSGLNGVSGIGVFTASTVEPAFGVSGASGLISQHWKLSGGLVPLLVDRI